MGRFGRVLCAAMACAAVTVSVSGCGSEKESPHAAEVMSALSAWSPHVTKVTQSGSRITVHTDFNESWDKTDLGAAYGMCRQLEITSIQGVYGATIESGGGGKLDSCALDITGQ